MTAKTKRRSLSKTKRVGSLKTAKRRISKRKRGGLWLKPKSFRSSIIPFNTSNLKGLLRIKRLSKKRPFRV